MSQTNMRIVIEIVAEDRVDALALLSDVRSKLRRRSERTGESVQTCIGAYRVVVEEPRTVGVEEEPKVT